MEGTGELSSNGNSQESTRPQRVRFEQQESGLKRVLLDSEVKVKLAQAVERGTISGLYDEVMKTTVQEVPRFFRSMKELDILEELMQLDLRGSTKGITSSSWGDPYAKSRCDGGFYYPHSREIKIAASHPTELEMLTSLGIDADLPVPVYTYAHEIAHHKQRYLYSANGELQLVTGVDTELMEAQAYLISRPELTVSEHLDFITTAKDSKGVILYPGLNRDKLRHSLWAFQFLTDTGYDQSRIAMLIRDPGKWDDKTTTYANIGDAVREQKEAKQLSPSDVRSVSRARQNNDRKEIRAITLDVLKKRIGLSHHNTGRVPAIVPGLKKSA